MEVTNENFKDVLPKIEKTISNATFLAIDCEFSGLNTVSEVNAFDTPKQYYEKVRKNCKDFLVLQYGISAFRYDKEAALFKQQTYNFYIFRRPINRNIPDQRFLCQTSSINFLILQGFDFNKLFKYGISYLNLSEEAVYREKIEERQKIKANQLTPQQNSTNSDIIPVPENMQPFLNDVMKQIEEFESGDGNEIELPKCNAFMRRLIYQTVGQNFKNKITLQTKTVNDKDRVLVASRFKSTKEQEEIVKKFHEDELAALDDFIGFTKVLRLIVDSGKLVIGHNMCLDFLHTIDKFLTPLSQDYDEFKECSHSLFKNILDTKFLANSDEFSQTITSTVLKDMLDTVTKEPFKMPAVEIEQGGEGYKIDEPKEHEAGFDAYITGLAFISMWNHLGALKGATDVFGNFNVLEPYINKLFLMTLRDNSYINLAGADPNPPRDHVFYLTFPKEWKLNNIIELFSPFGGVYVSWINESSAFVALYKKDQSQVVLNTLSQSDTYSIMTYAKRQSLLIDDEKNNSSILTANRNRKRSFEITPKPYKKQKTEFFAQGSSKNNEMNKRILIEPEAEIKNTKKFKPEKKTFMESDAWE